MASTTEALAGVNVPCGECGQPADGQAKATQLMDKPDEPWNLCRRCWRSLHGMKRVGPLRRLS
jgi:hypothetical protein